MDLPLKLLETTIEENHIYFFTPNAPIGVKSHMHICIKIKDELLLFSACTSQTDTVYRLAQRKKWDLNTFPCFKQNDTNKFEKELTYVNCNHIIRCEKDSFINMLKNKSVIRLDGTLTDNDIRLISQGVKLSPVVTDDIKNLF